ncbi:hypothetical protein LTR91_000884 [Friedmanniomyces endolithicus]|uniref:Survival motor neuron Tudor domain-containing protein n=1 Tax=Friedmanniomyces endolithicus TaxID=329885 RepID=A0AAN6R2E3_9PEZI|nr:hypothetical protein LTR94_009142 [Friedmanniomyces endolithicus]KAK0796963.1 hypothetical protein LTR38_008374 [Friedmanniomyces endolithicus]KAK0810756.1 hypothetical protein LTR75_005484 [Friedmanniomyces endolithicus]KAK0871324.1 hypothetical protein LTS02_001968 [Friedmanniomyces endolithicus]KAK0904912.1 hypothetical protein LTR02_006776 [Friedmanniomyces endolithicus]
MAKKASHAEIWDDSALVTSWNEALADLAAKGETIEVILDKAENGELDASEDAVPEAELTVDQAPGPSGVTTNGISAAAATATLPAARQDLPSTAVGAASTAAVPQLLLNQGKYTATIFPTPNLLQDEGLKNVMMSWYYAGYYTGLYEGQQKAHAGMQREGG